MADDIQKVWAKMHLNTYYPLVGNTEFRFFDANLMEQITQAGQQRVREIATTLGVTFDDHRLSHGHS